MRSEKDCPGWRKPLSRFRVPGGRSPNGAVDHLTRGPTVENHVNRSRLAHGESASALVISARCRPGYEVAATGRMSDTQRR